MSDPLAHLLSEGIIEEVISRLKSGKEADIYLVQHAGEIVAAKIYKERHARNFHNNSAYREGRVVRNSRTQRAMERGSRFGQQAAEEAWKSAESDALAKLHAAGVRVPQPVMFYEGVLLMECVIDASGHPAPRLIDAPIEPERAAEYYADLRSQVVTMLTCDLIHGDLSPYNVLFAWNGPAIIDFPQVIGAAHNSQAFFFFQRDLETIRRFFASLDPSLNAHADDARQIWRAYERRELTKDFVPSRSSGPRPGRRQEVPGSAPRGRQDSRGGADSTRGPQQARGRDSARGRQDPRGGGEFLRGARDDRGGESGRDRQEVPRGGEAGRSPEELPRGGEPRRGRQDTRGGDFGRGAQDSRGGGEPGRGRQDTRGGQSDRGRRDTRGGDFGRGAQDTRAVGSERSAQDARGGERGRGRQDTRGAEFGRGRQDTRAGDPRQGRQDPRGGEPRQGRQDPRGGEPGRGRQDTRGGQQSRAEHHRRNDPPAGATPQREQKGPLVSYVGAAPPGGASSQPSSGPRRERPGPPRRQGRGKGQLP